MKIISENHPDILTIACDLLHQGEVISFATDTVYGVACDASNPKAVERLYEIKKRDYKKPIAIFVKNLAIAEEIFVFDEISRKIAKRFLPGGLTLILPKKQDNGVKLAENLNPNNNSLGFRIVNNHFVVQLMAKFDGILAVTSANLSDHKAALSTKEVENYFSNSKLALVIDKKMPKTTEASTVVKVENNEVSIIRHGAVTEQSIRLALNL